MRQLALCLSLVLSQAAFAQTLPSASTPSNEGSPGGGLPRQVSAIRIGDHFETVKPRLGEVRVDPDQGYDNQRLRTCGHMRLQSDFKDGELTLHVTDFQVRGYAYRRPVAGATASGLIEIFSRAYGQPDQLILFDRDHRPVKARADAQVAVMRYGKRGEFNGEPLYGRDGVIWINTSTHDYLDAVAGQYRIERLEQPDRASLLALRDCLKNPSSKTTTALAK
jgi:hypothetical protein